MAVTNITVDVYCRESYNNDTIYRVYVDDELLTERTWIWPPYEIYIKEHIEVDINPGSHSVRIETCQDRNNLYAKNLTVNGEPVNSQDLSFAI